MSISLVLQFDGRVPNGTNVIGVLPGQLWGTKHDEILVVGAHWDTFPFSEGMDDNGSGVTALLEVNKIICHFSKLCIQFTARKQT